MLAISSSLSAAAAVLLVFSLLVDCGQGFQTVHRVPPFAYEYEYASASVSASTGAGAGAGSTSTALHTKASTNTSTNTSTNRNNNNNNNSKNNIIEGSTGMPSSPGWKSARLNRLTKWADSRTPNRPIICEYDPSGFWLWRKWKGTVLKSTWGSVLLAMGAGLVLDFFARRRHFSSSGGATTIIADTSSRLLLSLWKWPWYAVPTATDPIIQGLTGLKIAWGYHLTLCTFILTFFTSQALTYWQKVYNTSRVIQGRINDFCMLFVVGANRATTEETVVDDDDDADKHKDKDSISKNKKGNKTLKKNTAGTKNNSKSKSKNGYTPEARALVKTCTRLIRMSHTFFWAVTPTASNGLNDCGRFLVDAANCPLPVDDNERIGPLLLSPYGLKALVNTGQLTKQEAAGLENSGLPPSQYAYILLVWVGLHSMNGLEDGTLRGGPGFEDNLLRQLTQLRAAMFDIDDFRAGRMPLAYMQLVQVLVDSLVMFSPFALYAEIGSLSIPLVGLLALFFRGLLILSKSFLDPFGIEGFEEQNIKVDVLVSELNFGAERRWIQAGGVLPTAAAADTTTSS